VFIGFKRIRCVQIFIWSDDGFVEDLKVVSIDFKPLSTHDLIETTMPNSIWLQMQKLTMLSLTLNIQFAGWLEDAECILILQAKSD